MAQELAIHTTDIPGLLIIDLPVYGDNRGWFKENWQREKMLAAGLPNFTPVQNNVSYNLSAGTTRGIHAEPWDKYVSVATGKIFGAWVDLRRGATFGRVVTAEVGPDTAVYVPRGVGNSFQTLEDATSYTYLVDDHWSAQAQGDYSFLNLADETAAISWPIPLEIAELSEKDKNHPPLAEVIPVKPAPYLLVGTDGQLGRELARQLTDSDTPFIGATRKELDLATPAAWADAYRWRSLRGIINAAAYTAVDLAETDRGRRQAWAANASGVSALADRAREAAIPLVQVSTDYVFDGSLPLGQEYGDDAELAPLGVYGQSKAAGEVAARAYRRHYIVRTSWVIGDGKNFVETMRSLAARGVDPVVIADQHGRPTFTQDLAAGILHLLENSADYGTYNLTNTGTVITWADLARETFALDGYDPARISDTTTQKYFEQAEYFSPRPANSALNLEKIIACGFTPRDHSRALRDYINDQQ